MLSPFSLFAKMKQITLEAKPRGGLGRNAARKLRQSGGIPAVIYGASGSRNLTVDKISFQLAWRDIRGRAALIELKTEGESESDFAIIQEAQRNPRTDAFTHIDFKEIVRGQDMEANIPVVTRGVPHGVRNYGGVLEINHDHVLVRCRPRNLPEFIEINVADLQIGRSLHLRDIEVPDEVTFLEDLDLVVVSCVGASSGAPSVDDEESEGDEEEEANVEKPKAEAEEKD